MAMGFAYADRIPTVKRRERRAPIVVVVPSCALRRLTTTLGLAINVVVLLCAGCASTPPPSNSLLIGLWVLDVSSPPTRFSGWRLNGLSGLEQREHRRSVVRHGPAVQTPDTGE